MERFGRTILACATAGLLALGCVLAASAIASAGAPASPVTPPSPAQPLSAGSLAAMNATYFAGYLTTKTGSSSVATTFKIPRISCGSTTNGIGPGAYMVARSSGSSNFDGAAVALECSNGAMNDGVYLIINNADMFTREPVTPGDTIQASVSVSGTATTASLRDLTKPHAFSLTATGAGGTAASEQVGVDSLVGIPGASFGSDAFSATTVGGQPLGTAAPTQLDLTSGCAILLTPTAISSGTNFTVRQPTISITGISPASGPTGTSVSLTGSGFNSGSTVKFNGQPAAGVTHVSSSQLKATVPITATTGPVSVANTAAPKGSATSVCFYFVTPTITSFAPASAITGSSVTIKGSGFSHVTKVAFGSHAARFKASSTTQLAATVPSGATAGKVSVTTQTGSTTSAQTFTPSLSITGFSPNSGPAKTVVTISGLGFNSSSKVSFNGKAATSVTHVSSAKLDATVPTGATTGLITVTNTSTPAGTVASASRYTVPPSHAPSISSFSPTSGITGSTVTIKGSFFTGAGKVTFGKLAARFKVVSASQVTATVPNGAVVGKLSVTTAGGTATSASAFTPTLSITGFSPAKGATGALVTIRGTGFNHSSKVSFNGKAATTVTFVSSGELKAKVPAAVTTGPITVTNTTAPAGKVTSAGKFT